MGARRWISLNGFNLQPSEFAKIGAALDGIGQARLGWNLGDPPRPGARVQWVTTPIGDLQVTTGPGAHAPRRQVLGAGLLTALVFLLPILAIMSVVPPDQLQGKGVSAFLDAIHHVFSVYGSAANVLTKIAAAGFILAVVSSACTWLMGSDRSQAVASYDGAGPRILGRFSARYGTPIYVNFLSGVFSTIVFLIAINLSSGSTADAFNVMIGVVLTFTTISYIVIFPCLAILRRTHPDVHRPYRVPGGMPGVWVCTILCTSWAVFASLVAIFPGFLDGQFLNNADLPANVSRLKYETISLVAIGVTMIAGFIFYWLGAPTRAAAVDVPLEGNEGMVPQTAGE